MLTLAVIIILRGRFMHEASNERMKNENNKTKNKLSSRLVTVYFSWPSLYVWISLFVIYYELPVSILFLMIVILKILFWSCESKAKIFLLNVTSYCFCFIVLKNYYIIESTVTRFFSLRDLSKITLKNHVFFF